MTRSIRIAFALVLFVLAVTPATLGVPGDNVGMIVSTAWLAEHLQDEKLVLLGVDRKESFDAAHIPGARQVALSDVGMNTPEGLILELRPLEELSRWANSVGIGNDSRIVIYVGKNASPTVAARFYLTLDYLGLGGQTSLLDGGIQAWEAEGRPLTAEATAPRQGTLTPTPKPEVIVAAQWVQQNLANPKVTVLDARTTDFYTGANDAGGRYPRPGHVPGAVSVTFRDVVDADTLKFKSREALAELFRAAGVKPGSRVVTYCHIGQQASLLYFVAKYIGYDAALYDGSLSEWTKLEMPIEKTSGKEQP